MLQDSLDCPSQPSRCGGSAHKHPSLYAHTHRKRAQRVRINLYTYTPGEHARAMNCMYLQMPLYTQDA